MIKKNKTKSLISRFGFGELINLIHRIVIEINLIACSSLITQHNAFKSEISNDSSTI